MGPLELLGRVAAALEGLGAPYAATGSVASSYYGEYRTTADVDVVADLKYGHVEAILRAFPGPEFYVSREGVLDALRHGGMFNIIHGESAIKADIIVAGARPLDRDVLARAHRVEVLPGVTVLLSSPEDLIVNKLLFYREGGSDKHLRDIAGILKISGDRLDRQYLERAAARTGVIDLWREVLQRVTR